MRVLRDTQALEVVGLEVTTSGNLRVIFKNVSARDINGFVLAISGSGDGVDSYLGQLVDIELARYDVRELTPDELLSALRRFTSESVSP